MDEFFMRDNLYGSVLQLIVSLSNLVIRHVEMGRRKSLQQATDQISAHINRQSQGSGLYLFRVHRPNIMDRRISCKIDFHGVSVADGILPNLCLDMSRMIYRRLIDQPKIDRTPPSERGMAQLIQNEGYQA